MAVGCSQIPNHHPANIFYLSQENERFKELWHLRTSLSLRNIFKTLKDLSKVLSNYLSTLAVGQSEQEPKSPESTYSASGMWMGILGIGHHMQETHPEHVLLNQTHILFLHPSQGFGIHLALTANSESWLKVSL